MSRLFFSRNIEDGNGRAGNHALFPHQGGGPRCATECPCNRTACRCSGVGGCRPSGCFANYGGQSSAFESNVGVQCYQDAVVIFGNVRDGLFGGAWNASSSVRVIGNVGMGRSCEFLWPINQGRAGFPGSVVCER
jgi:hypothetical protein